MKLPVNYNTIHSNGEIFEILLQTSFLLQCIETTVQQRVYLAEDVYSAGTVIKRITTFGWERILVDLKAINGQLFKGWVDKPKGTAYIAMEYHDIPRYIQKKRDWKPRKKKCDDVERIVHSKKQCGTHCFDRVLSYFFITNLPVDFQDIAFQLARDFRKRWCIETGYKTKKKIRSKTC